MDQITRACQQLDQNDCSLTLLNLSCGGIGSEGVRRLAKSCGSCSPIVALWLENNYIYPKGAESISQVIKSSPNIKYLYLAHNCLNNGGVNGLVPTAFQQLEVCNLVDNGIGPVGAQTIAATLASQESEIQSLILGDNRIGDDGAMHLAESLKSNTTLETLDLRFNRIGKQGLMALRDVLIKDNKHLRFLFLEEEDDPCCQACDEQSASPSSPPTKSARRRPTRCRCTRLLLEHQRECRCERCTIRAEIEYYLALNRAGRHAFESVDFPCSLWPRVMERHSWDDPSLIYGMLSGRPDVAASTR